MFIRVRKFFAKTEVYLGAIAIIGVAALVSIAAFQPSHPMPGKHSGYVSNGGPGTIQRQEAMQAAIDGLAGHDVDYVEVAAGSTRTPCNAHGGRHWYLVEDVHSTTQYQTCCNFGHSPVSCSVVRRMRAY